LKDKAERDAREFAKQKQLFEKEQAKREARRREQEVARIKKRSADEELRKQTKQLEAKKEAVKLAERARVNSLYEEARLAWEKHNGRGITSSAAWELYEIALATVNKKPPPIKK